MSSHLGRGEGTHPRAHSKSAVEPVIPGDWPQSGQRLVPGPGLVQGGGCLNICFAPPQFGQVALFNLVMLFPLSGLSIWCTGCPCWELRLHKEMGHLFGFAYYRPDFPTLWRQPQDTDQRPCSGGGGLAKNLGLILNSSLLSAPSPVSGR